jgi:hypothetical protein
LLTPVLIEKSGSIGQKERRRLKMAGMIEAIPARSTPPAEPIPYQPLVGLGGG